MFPFQPPRYAYDVPLDPGLVLRQSSPVTPIMLLYTREGDLAERLFTEFAAKKQTTSAVVSLSNAEPNEERRARKAIQKAMQDVSETHPWTPSIKLLPSKNYAYFNLSFFFPMVQLMVRIMLCLPELSDFTRFFL